MPPKKWNTPLIADFNGDGLMDVVESDALFSLVYLQGYGDGTFRASPTYPLPNSFDTGAFTESVASGDFKIGVVSLFIAVPLF